MTRYTDEWMSGRRAKMPLHEDMCRLREANRVAFAHVMHRYDQAYLDGTPLDQL